MSKFWECNSLDPKFLFVNCHGSVLKFSFRLRFLFLGSTLYTWIHFNMPCCQFFCYCSVLWFYNFLDKVFNKVISNYFNMRLSIILKPDSFDFVPSTWIHFNMQCCQFSCCWTFLLFYNFWIKFFNPLYVSTATSHNEIVLQSLLLYKISLDHFYVQSRLKHK